MTSWADVKTLGSGRIALRLAVAGMPYEAVSDASMAGTVNNGLTDIAVGGSICARVPGLLFDGLVLEERVDMARALNEVTPLTATMVDVLSPLDSVLTPWTKLFSKRPDTRTYIDATCTDIATSITVRSTAGFASSGAIWIDQECITYTSVDATHFLGCARGVAQTVPTYHYGLDTARARATEVTDWPASMEGRHAFLYAYGPLDSLGGDGSIIWRGIVSRDARLVEGTSWTLDIDPITRVFEQSIGGDLSAPVPCRGIYYPFGCCLYIAIYVSTTANASDIPASPTAELQITGHYEDQDAFCRYVQSQIDGSAAANKGLKCVPDGPGGWHFELQTPTATPKHVGLLAFSPIDEVHAYFNAGAGGGGIPLNQGTVPDWTTVGTSGAVAVSTTYIYAHGPQGSFLTNPSYVPAGTSYFATNTDAVVTPGAVPRGAFTTSTVEGMAASTMRCVKSADASTYPNTRIYLGGYVSLSGIGSVTIDMSGTGDGPNVSDVLSTRDAASRMIDFGLGGRGSTPAAQSCFFAGVPGPQVQPTRDYGFGTLHDLRAALIAQVNSGAPLGTAPYIYDATLFGSEALTSDFGAWDAATSAAAGRTIAYRAWNYSKAQKLGEVLAEEAKNIGCFFALDSTGRIELRQIGVAPTTTGVRTIDSTSEITDEGPSGWERNALGSVNRVLIQQGYDPTKDSWTGSPIMLADPTAVGRNPSGQTIEIKPRSQWFPPPGMGGASIYDDYAAVTSSLFGVYAYPYNTITVTVPFTFFDVMCGDLVAITSKNLPDGAGARSMTARNGIVIGRRIDFSASAIQLTILSSEVNYAGYTPTSRISSSVNTSGFNYTLTIATPAAGPTRAYSDGTAWKNGDVIRVIVWGSTTTTIQTGTVTADGTATTVLVTLAGAIPGGTINLEYGLASAGWTANQQQYCAIAAATDRIDYGSSTANARQFAG